MSNINNSPVTKLRSNEKLKNCSLNQLNYDYGLQASGSPQNSDPKIISEPKRHKSVGRGLAIQQLAESMSTNNMNNSNMNFSNASIESYFKCLREENEKKLKEKNEKIWEKSIHSERNANI